MKAAALERPAAQADSPVLEVRDLRVSFATPTGRLRAVDGVSFDLRAGEVLALVGESGSGKSATGTSVLRLTESVHGCGVDGSIRLGDLDVRRLRQKELRSVRGRRIGLVSQNPMTALSPVRTVGSQLTELLRAHAPLGRGAARERAVELLRSVGVPDPERRMDAYPHQLSGGTLQRIVIAMAISCGPDVLIADEPTTALDVTLQQQILELLRELIERVGMGVLFVTHNLGVVADLADRVAIMYAGRIVEIGPVDEIFANPRHPYTAALLRSVPRLDSSLTEELAVIPGTPHARFGEDSGCAFRARCPVAIGECAENDPMLEPQTVGHEVACWVRPDAQTAVAAATEEAS